MVSEWETYELQWPQQNSAVRIRPRWRLSAKSNQSGTFGGPFTTLAQRDVVRDLDDNKVISLVTEGVSGAMPGLGRTPTREQMAGLVAFMRGWVGSNCPGGLK